MPGIEGLKYDRGTDMVDLLQRRYYTRVDESRQKGVEDDGNKVPEHTFKIQESEYNRKY